MKGSDEDTLLRERRGEGQRSHGESTGEFVKVSQSFRDLPDGNTVRRSLRHALTQPDNVRTQAPVGRRRERQTLRSVDRSYESLPYGCITASDGDRPGTRKRLDSGRILSAAPGGR